MDRLDTSKVSSLRVCWETCVRVSDHLAELHLIVSNLARPSTNMGGIASIINGLESSSCNTFTIQQGPTQVSSALQNSPFSSVSKVSALIPSYQRQLAPHLSHCRGYGQASSGLSACCDSAQATILCAPLV